MIFGLGMIMDIKTMDRFDDPKGKTITITATE
jgi:V-type H+-transporting ATPase S1 subunit